MNTNSVGFNRFSAATFTLSLLAGFFMFSVAQAFTGTFVATETVSNTAPSTVPAIVLAGGADPVATSTLTAAALSGGVDAVGAAASSGGFTVTGGTPGFGTTTSISVGGVEILGATVAASTTFANSAQDLASQINSYSLNYTAVAVGATVTITASTTGPAGNGFLNAATQGDMTFGGTSDLTGGADGTPDVKATTTTSPFDTITTQAGADLTLNIGGTAITLTAGEIPANTAISVASQINNDAGNAYTAATINVDQVKLTSKASGTAGNAALVATDLEYNTTHLTAASTTITIPAGLVSSAYDHSITIDGVTIDLGGAVLTASQVAAAIAAADFSGGTSYATSSYTVTNPSGADVTFIRTAAGSAGNGALVLSDDSYGARAQVVTWTPSSPTVGETYRATVNGTDYDLTITNPIPSIASIVSTLANYIDVDAAVGCSNDGTKTICTASTPGTSFTFDGVVVDITAPVVSEVTPVTTPFNDTTPDYTFTTDEAGTINYGGDCSSATTAAATSSNTVTFNTLSEGTHSNCQISVTDLWGNTGASTTVSSFTIDTTAPTVAVTSTQPDGAYSTSTNINVTLTFSEPVTSTDSLTVTLETGTTDRTCTVPAMSTSTVGTCTYTVQAGDTTSDLAVSSIVVDNGGTIKDAATNNANLTPTSNISDTSNIVIDTTDPVVNSVSYAPTSGMLAIGDILTLTITADAAGYTLGSATVNGVAVTGFTDNGNNTYTAYYTVGSGDSDRANTDEVPVSVVLKDGANNTNSPFTTAPAAGLTPAIDANAPAVSAPDLTAGTDSGVSSSDDITYVTTPTFTGTAEVGSTVRLYDGATQIGSYLASDGTWTITSSALSDGVHAVGATATDAVGNTSATSSTLSVTVDTVSPAVGTPDLDAASDTGSSDTDDLTQDNTPTFSGTGEDGTVVLYDGSTAVGSGTASGNAWQITTSALSDGAHTIAAVNTDTAGNASATSTGLTVTIDTVVPVLTEDTPVVNPTNDTTPAYSFHSTEAGTVTYGGSCSSGTSAVSAGTTTVSFNALAEGTYSDCTVTVTDGAGKQSSALSVSPFTIDTTSPTVTLSSGVGSFTNAPFSITVTFSEGTSDFDASDIAVTNATTSNFVAVSTTTYTAQINPVSEGAVSATVNAGVAHDAATNPNTAGNTVNSSYDITRPTLTSVSIASNNASTTLAKAGDTITVSFAANEHINTPTVTINGHSASPSGTPLVGPFTAIYQMTGADADGPITFTIDITDLATNANIQATTTTNGSAVIFDNTPPVATVTTSDADGVLASSTTITVTATFNEPVQDSPVPTISAFGADSFASTTMTKVDSTHYTYVYTGGTGNGTTTFSVGGAVDMTGNTEVGESGSVILDNTAPVITVTGSNPDTIVTSNTAYADAGATALDNHDGAVTVVSSGTVNNVTAGTYVINYSATDAAGNVATSSRTVVINATGNGPVSGGGGGGGGPIGSISAFNQNPAPIPNGGGQVLGASSYHFTLNLSIGSRGEEVRALQQVLIDEGFLKIAAPTDYFGPLTQAALKLYQAKYGIPQVGIVGPLTRAQLNKGSAPTGPKLPENQISSILNLLNSFDIDPAVLKTVEDILRGN